MANSFIHVVTEYLLSPYHTPDTVLRTGIETMNKTNKVLALTGSQQMS